MNILVTLNANYLIALKVMLKSLFINNPDESFHIYLMHSSIPDDAIEDVNRRIESEGHRLSVIRMREDWFQDAPVLKHYSKEMYYRLLAFKFLPPEMDKILYLDPDLIVINPLRGLYDTDIDDYLFAAAFHDRVSVKEVNKLRLMPYEIAAYYNTGVMLMNLARQRELIKEKDIFDFVEKNKVRLILPDQDIVNALYSKHIKEVDEILYNFDPRFYLYHKLVSKGLYDMDFIVRNTSIIHFCGKKKPWNKNYSGMFHSLYKHYEKLAFPQGHAENHVAPN